MRSLLLVLTIACGPKSVQEPVGNRAAPPPRPACTEMRVAAMAKDLQARWNSSALPVVRCTSGLFPTPGFYIEVDNGESHRAGVLAVDGKTELVPFVEQAARMVATDIVECTTVDLDGDGIDEIVESWRQSALGQMGSDNWLEIRRVSEHAFTTVRGPHTSVYHPELGGCSAEVQLAGQTIVITVQNLVGIPPSNCLPAGTHTFLLDKQRVVEITKHASR